MRHAKARPKRAVEKCCGKTAYHSQSHALGAAITASRKTGKAIRAYRGRCGKWHHTSQPKREKQLDSAA